MKMIQSQNLPTKLDKGESANNYKTVVVTNTDLTARNTFERECTLLYHEPISTNPGPMTRSKGEEPTDGRDGAFPQTTWSD